jgi:hypothetical protein
MLLRLVLVLWMRMTRMMMRMAVEDVFASPVADTGAGTGTEDTEQKAEEESAPSEPARSKGRKKATSYLDELLAERAKKRKKR